MTSPNKSFFFQYFFLLSGDENFSDANSECAKVLNLSEI